MQAVLKELFYGNINPNAKQFVRNSEYGKALKIVSDCEEKLNTLLGVYMNGSTVYWASAWDVKRKSPARHCPASSEHSLS